MTHLPWGGEKRILLLRTIKLSLMANDTIAIVHRGALLVATVNASLILSRELKGKE